VVKIEESGEPKKEESKFSLKKIMKDIKKIFSNDTRKYFFITMIVVALVVGIIATNAINNKVIDKLSSENRQTIDSLQEEKETLRTERDEAEVLYEKVLAQKRELEAELEQVEGIFQSFDEQGEETRREVKHYYEAKWDKYIFMRPNETITTSLSIENMVTNEQTYDIKVMKTYTYNKAVLDTYEQTTLTLSRDGIGGPDIKFESRAEGYAIYGVSVNDHYVGDIVIFVKG